MTYLIIGIVLIVVGVMAVLIRSSRRTYHPDSGGAMGAKGRRTKLDGQERSTRWGAGM